MRYLGGTLILAGLIASASPLQAAPNVFWTFGFDFPASPARAGTSADTAMTRSIMAVAHAPRARLAAQGAVAQRPALVAPAIAVLDGEDVRQTIVLR